MTLLFWEHPGSDPNAGLGLLHLGLGFEGKASQQSKIVGHMDAIISGLDG